MWSDQKHQRFQELRQPDRQLSPAEQEELASLVKDLEAEESAYLKPAIERLRQENARIEKQNRKLANLFQRKEELARRLEVTLNEARAEENAIENELAAVLSGSPTSDAD